MNSGSFNLDPISQNGVLVTIALALVAVLAVLTIIAMVWGARLKRQRRAAEEEEQRRIEELKADGVEVTNTAEGGSPVVTAAAPTPSAPPRPAPAPAAPVPAPAPIAPTPAEHVAEDHQAALSDEPIAAAAPLDATPASVAADAPIAPIEEGGAQSVTILKGLGPKIATRLSELGITRLDQLAWLDDAEAEQLDAQLGVFQGRMERDRWREQARLLAQGDRAGYEAQFGKLG
ncbi:hypothetical protein [Sphingomonas sp. 8AM]|uniref:hypothetical protein n=1 Tax=Sphingomonas sp. 8AM TaxID=2653170 RepID=UPI0012F412BE|nr:hypothetical protein [Sphingomonas sp. 8AM]VXC86601.1 conserved hypothetical protein [Sphingomonas sp. 8AM]